MNEEPIEAREGSCQGIMKLTRYRLMSEAFERAQNGRINHMKDTAGRTYSLVFSGHDFDDGVIVKCVEDIGAHTTRLCWTQHVTPEDDDFFVKVVGMAYDRYHDLTRPKFN